MSYPLDTTTLPGHLQHVRGLAEEYGLAGGRLDIGDDKLHLDQESTGSVQPEALDSAVEITEVSLVLQLAKALEARYRDAQNPTDLDRLVALLDTHQAVLAGVHATHPEVALLLGEALLNRFLDTEDGSCRDDLDRAVALHRSLCEPPNPDENFSGRLEGGLGAALLHQYRYHRDAAKLSEALALLKKALLHCSPKSTRRGPLHVTLATALLHVYETAPQHGLSDLQSAHALCTEGLSLPLLGSQDRKRGLVTLAQILLHLYMRSNDPAKLDETIHHAELALQLCSLVSAERGIMTNHLGVALYYRYARTGFSGDIDRAIYLQEQILEGRDHQHANRLGLLNTYSNLLNARHQTTHNLDDLEASLKARRECAQLISPGDPRYPMALHNLGVVFLLRFMAFGVNEDIDASIETMQRASEIVSLAANSSIEHFKMGVNLPLALFTRFEKIGRPGDLNQAVMLFEEHLSRTATLGQNYLDSESYEHAADALLALYRRDRSAEHLEQSISYYEKVLELRQPISFPQAKTIQALVYARMARFYHHHDCRDAQIASELQTEACRLAPSGHPAHVRVACGLAHLCLSVGSPLYDIGAALDSLLDALSDGHITAQTQLHESVGVLGKLLNELDVSNLGEVVMSKLQMTYRRILELLPRIAFLGLSARSRLQVLKETESFVRGAASHAIAINRPGLALEMLEQGRAVFWSQYLRIRYDFESQGASHDDAQELSKLSRQLQHGEQVTFNQGGTSEKNQTHSEELAAEQRKIGVRFEALIEKVRSQPGCDRFLLSDTLTVLAQATDRHPIIVLLSNQLACFALVVNNSANTPVSVVRLQITAERLAALNQELQSANKLDRKRLEVGRGVRMAMKTDTKYVLIDPSRRLLQELWVAVVQPVFQSLNLQKSNSDTRPRLHLCTTGTFARLPVHAACDYGRNRRPIQTFSHFAIPSYTPTLGILLAARRHVPVIRKDESQILLAAVRQGFQWQPLLCAQVEARIIRSIVPPRSILPLNAQSATSPDTHVLEPTADDVSRMLPVANILHLACHGYQSKTNPLASGFIMSDTILTVEKLMALQLPNSLFAFLSACETAKGDDQQPDQVIHLAATLMFAGFKSVIGTMWSMNDVDGPVVAEIVYEKLFKGEGEFVDPELIPRALDVAVSTLQNRGVCPSRWAPYVHLGV